jgi:HK97 gp10 family phage protein
MAKAQVIGVDKFRTGIAVTLAAQRKDLDSGLRAMADQLAQQIQANCPSLTGALKASVKVVESPGPAGRRIKIEIGNSTVDYAAHVEYGTSHAAARPFVRPAVEKARQQFPGQIEHLIEQTWSGK